MAATDFSRHPLYLGLGAGVIVGPALTGDPARYSADCPPTPDAETGYRLRAATVAETQRDFDALKVQVAKAPAAR